MTASVTGRRRRSQRRNFFCALLFQRFLPARSSQAFFRTILLSPYDQCNEQIKQAACPLHGAEPKVEAMPRAKGFGIKNEQTLANEQLVELAMQLVKPQQQESHADPQ